MKKKQMMKQQAEGIKQQVSEDRANEEEDDPITAKAKRLEEARKLKK